MHYKKKNCAIITAVILISNTYSQYKDIPTEVKTPIKILGIEDDEVVFYRQNSVVYSSRNSHVYVADTWNNRVVVLDPELNFIKTIGRKGQGPGEFKFPLFVTVDKIGNLVVS